MKKIKLSVFGMLLAMMVFALTACGRDDTGMDSTSGAMNPTTTQAVTTPRESDTMMGTDSGMDNNREEGSTGVIGGMIDDVERGVDDVLDGTTEMTNAADETTR